MYDVGQLLDTWYKVLRGGSEMSHRSDIGVRMSHKGAIGIAQVMPGTYKDYCKTFGLKYRLTDLMIERINLAAGQWYFTRCWFFFGTPWQAVNAYNRGIEGTRRGEIMTNYLRRVYVDYR